MVYVFLNTSEGVDLFLEPNAFRASLIPLYDNNSFECQTMDEIDHIATKDSTYADFNDTQKNKPFTEYASDGMGSAKNKTCPNAVCTNLAVLGMTGTRTAEYCGQHAMGTMVNLANKRPIHESCGKNLALGVDGRKTVEYCAQHAPDEIVSVSSKRCRIEGSSFGVIGTKTVEYCAQHALDRMVNVRRKECRTEGCGKQRSFGVPGTKTAEYCAQHALDGMVNVRSRKCRTEGCGKQSSFGVPVRKRRSTAHNMPMADVRSRKCRTEGCCKQPAWSSRFENGEYCTQHAPDGMVKNTAGWSTSAA